MITNSIFSVVLYKAKGLNLWISLIFTKMKKNA